MALPVSVVLDRGDMAALDLTPHLEPGSLDWSSVVPGGFASCAFQVNGDFRRLLHEIPYLAIIRVIGDSGRILFEGQIEDLAATLSDTTVGVKVGAYGLQNVLKETSVRAIWSKRDMQWDTALLPPAATMQFWTIDPSLTVSTGQFDPTDLSKSGVRVTPNGGVSTPNLGGAFATWVFPDGLTVLYILGTIASAGGDSGGNQWQSALSLLSGGTWPNIAHNPASGSYPLNADVNGYTGIALGAVNDSGAAATLNADDTMDFYDLRLLGVLTSEAGTGFYGGTLIRSLIGTYVTELREGTIEDGTDFTIDHLDASVRRLASDILTEVASYYSREWAVWEDARFDWVTPNLSDPQWIVPLSALTALDLDASVQNSQKESIVLYTDAVTGETAEASATSTDRRNPYVLNGRTKDQLNTQNLMMTANTAAQLASAILNDLGFGPVPAAGTIALPGETIVGHADGRHLKAWEIRAGDNVTLPELPLADVFTSDGRGEILFHIVSAEAETQTGTVTLTLDSYGSKRSDVLLARLAAVTQLLGG